MAKSSQKFIAQNRAPRVQIEYDVELYGAEKKVQLPFVMGVMSDLSGKSNIDQGSVASRKFLEIDVDNFDERMKGIAPRAAFSVPNTLTGDGNMSVDLTFEKMSDFEPGAIAARVDSLRPLLEARQQLSNLMAYMDGKAGAESLIETILADPALLGALAGGPGTRDADQMAALDALRQSHVPQDAPIRETDDALDALRAVEVAPDVTDTGEAALEALRKAEVSAPESTDDTGAALDALRAAEVKADAPEDTSEDALAALKSVAPQDEAPKDKTGSTLDALRSDPPPEETSEESDAALDALRMTPTPEKSPDDSAQALDALRAAETIREEAVDESGATLDALRATDTPTVEPVDTTAAALGSLPDAPSAQPVQDDLSDVLSRIQAPEETDETETADDVLASLEAAPQDTPQDDTDDILAGVEAIEVPSETDTIDAALAGLEAPTETVDVDTTNDVLAGLEAVDSPEPQPTPGDMVGAALAGLEPVETQQAPSRADALDAALADVEIPSDAPAKDIAEEVLAGIEPVADAAPLTDLDDLLADLEAPEEVQETTTTDDILAEIEAAPEIAPAEDLDALLADLEAPETAEEVTTADDILADLEAAPEPEPSDDLEALLADIEAPEAVQETTSTDDILAEIEETPTTAPAEDDDLDTLLAGLDVPDDAGETAAPEEGIADILDGLEAPETETEAADDLDALLAGIDDAAPEEIHDRNDLDDLLADLGASDVGDAPETEDLDAILAGLEDTSTDATAQDADLDDILADLEADEVGDAQSDASLDALLSDLNTETEADDSDGLDDLLAELEPEDIQSEQANDDLDALLADLDAPEEAQTPTPDDDLDALLANLEGGTANVEPSAEDDLDALLAGLEADVPASEDLATSPQHPEPEPEEIPELALTPDPEPRAEEPALVYGEISAERPEPVKLTRKRFRMAILGDFTGRAARGLVEVGDALASRGPILLDPDTVEDVIEGFATTLMLPIGKEGAAIEVKLGGLDDLHPDELYENVEIFSALKDLKSQLTHGATAENAAKSLSAWGAAYDRPVAPASAVSTGTTVRADLRLSDFQKLIGDSGGTLSTATPLDDMLARIVGPHIRKLPDPTTVAMAEAVDAALSGAMRLVLHHPDFQSIEAQWRALDLIARSVEVDDDLEVVLYDISAEEIAADLTQSDDLSDSGFVRLLTEGPMDPETGRGAYSALMGLYTFEETPPHAHLLGRIARVAAHVDAPFFAAITPGFIETPKKDRHPLVAKAWDTLRSMPEAGHLGLAAPRFMLRRPYGAKSEPIYEFDFEEFTETAGLSGMLWANPVVLVSILLAKSFKENGPSMGLGQIMSLGEIPYHYVNDRYGDQVALPCTERNLTLDKIETVVARGYMPVISIKGRDEVRLGSFQSLAGAEILGPWSDVPPPPPSPAEPDVAQETTDTTQDPDPETAASVDQELDALLAGFDLDAGADDDLNDDDMDAELAALLADL